MSLKKLCSIEDEEDWRMSRKERISFGFTFTYWYSSLLMTRNTILSGLHVWESRRGMCLTFLVKKKTWKWKESRIPSMTKKIRRKSRIPANKVLNVRNSSLHGEGKKDASFLKAADTVFMSQRRLNETCSWLNVRTHVFKSWKSFFERRRRHYFPFQVFPSFLLSLWRPFPLTHNLVSLQSLPKGMSDDEETEKVESNLFVRLRQSDEKIHCKECGSRRENWMKWGTDESERWIWQSCCKTSQLNLSTVSTQVKDASLTCFVYQLYYYMTITW